MHEITSHLQKIVLPKVRAGEGRLVPSDAGGFSASTGFVEAYPHESERHSYFEWFWMLSGTATMKIDGQIFELAPGDFCFLPPLLRHADVYTEHTPAYQSLWFSCWPETIGSHLFSYRPVGDWEVPSYSMASGHPKAWEIANALQAEIAGTEEFREEAVHGLVLQLTVMLLRIFNPAISDPRNGYYSGTASRRVLQYLRERYGQNIALDDIAEAVGFSPHYLASVFKKETGKTIFNALTEIRLNHAKRLIAEQHLPIQEVAAAVGFSSPHHFSRVFRRVEGVPPSHFQKK